ncbi:hypothetical protein [Pseudomonas sp. RIT-To-2]|uniref:hypothetical protein n=1 Tax=Pseudomonas sp. RIT-To-2 TaxID=3462541 RepID=UPI002412F187
MNQNYTMTKAERIAKLRELRNDVIFSVRGEEESTPSAAVVNNSVMSFTEGVSKQNIKDLKNAYLFATTTADKRNPGGKESGERWYKDFVTLMATAGWVESGGSYRAFTSTEKNFSMDKIALEILKGAAITATMAATGGSAALGLMDTARNALEAVSKDKEAVDMFDRNAMKDRGANFGIGAVTQINDEVCMAYGLVQYDTKASSTTVLFSTWDSSEVAIYQANTVFWMNEDAVEDTRDHIRDAMREERLRALHELTGINKPKA